MKPLIVALDVETDQEALGLVRMLKPHVDLFKVGPVLFLKYGGALIAELRSLGAEIFLDMKFHDIPSVVAKAVERAGEWGVYSATIHTSGGVEMMKEAARVSKRPLLWGVTVLTSLEHKDLLRIGITRPVREQVQNLAKLALSAKLDGVISSVEEARAIKKACGREFQVVTPGIRAPQIGRSPAGSVAGGLPKALDDQKRVQTPKAAMNEGADFFVMGRPVTESADPVLTVQEIYQSLRRPR
jgi:orotidine-5'-phosphate decarboxylase